jgi:hypothetical protein
VPIVTANIVARTPIHNACHASIRHDWRAPLARGLLLTDNKNATVLAAERSARVASQLRRKCQPEIPAGRKRRRIIRSDLRCFNKEIRPAETIRAA